MSSKNQRASNIVMTIWDLNHGKEPFKLQTDRSYLLGVKEAFLHLSDCMSFLAYCCNPTYYKTYCTQIREEVIFKMLGSLKTLPPYSKKIKSFSYILVGDLKKIVALAYQIRHQAEMHQSLASHSLSRNQQRDAKTENTPFWYV